MERSLPCLFVSVPVPFEAACLDPNLLLQGLRVLFVGGEVLASFFVGLRLKSICG